MWFNNALSYKYEFNETFDVNQLLSEATLKPCPPHARFIYGWLPIFEDCFAHEVAGSFLICMGKEERILPRSIILRELNNRAQLREVQGLHPLKRSEKAQMAEEIEFELLPKAFCLEKRLYALFDTKSQRLMINTASQTQASQLISLLIKGLPGIHIEPIKVTSPLATNFAEWINNPSSVPASLQLASDCLLFSPDNENKRLQCKGYELPAEEILSLLNQGHMPAEISLQWQERIQFTLTQDLVIKKIKCLDYLTEAFSETAQLDDEAQQRDAALTLLAGELRSLIDDLLNHFLKVNQKTVTNTPNLVSVD